MNLINSLSPKLNPATDFPYVTFSVLFLSHRAISPVIVGSSFAWSISEGFKLGFPLNEHFAFAILVIITVLSILLSCLLPEGLNRRYVTAERVWSQSVQASIQQLRMQRDARVGHQSRIIVSIHFVCCQVFACLALKQVPDLLIREW